LAACEKTCELGQARKGAAVAELFCDAFVDRRFVTAIENWLRQYFNYAELLLLKVSFANISITLSCCY